MQPIIKEEDDDSFIYGGLKNKKHRLKRKKIKTKPIQKSAPQN